MKDLMIKWLLLMLGGVIGMAVFAILSAASRADELMERYRFGKDNEHDGTDY